MGAIVVGAQNDLAFDPVNTPIAAVGACSATTDQTCAADADCPPAESCRILPDCTVNPAIKKELTAFNFLPIGCVPGRDCTVVRALVYSFISLNRPIADGSALYTCRVDIAPGARPGEYPVTVPDVVLAYPVPPGGAVAGATGTSGTIVVSSGSP
jgi:hypothetical protein